MHRYRAALCLMPLQGGSFVDLDRHVTPPRLTPTPVTPFPGFTCFTSLSQGQLALPSLVQGFLMTQVHVQGRLESLSRVQAATRGKVEPVALTP